MRLTESKYEVIQCLETLQELECAPAGAPEGAIQEATVLRHIAVIEVLRDRGSVHERTDLLARPWMDRDGPVRRVVQDHLVRLLRSAVEEECSDVESEVLDVLALGSEGKSAHRRVHTVAADDDVEASGCCSLEGDVDTPTVLPKADDRLVEEELCVVRGRIAQDASEVAPEHLDSDRRR